MPSKRSPKWLNAATLSAPAGSAMMPSLWYSPIISVQTWPSETSSTSLINSRQIAKFVAPTVLTAAPSTNVSICGSVTGCPASSAREKTRRTRRFDTDKPRVGEIGLGIDRQATEEAAAADRHDQEIGRLRHLCHKFDPHRSLPGDDPGVVERMHEDFFVRLRVLRGLAISIVERIPDQLYRCPRPAQCPHSLHLLTGRIFRHIDPALDTKLTARERDSLSMVASAGTDHPSCAFDFRKRTHQVVCTAYLVRADKLQILALQVNFRPVLLRQTAAALQRRLFDDALQFGVSGFNGIGQ